MWSWIKNQWREPKNRWKIIVACLVCVVLIVGLTALLALILQKIVAMMIPIIIICIIIIAMCWDSLMDNYHWNRQQAALAEQRQQIEGQALYYQILRHVVLPAMEAICRCRIYEGLVVYDGPYLYGSGPNGPIFYFRVPVDEYPILARRLTELRQRIRRILSNLNNISYADTATCVKYGHGPDGQIVLLICLDPDILPAVDNQKKRRVTHRRS